MRICKTWMEKFNVMLWIKYNHPPTNIMFQLFSIKSEKLSLFILHIGGMLLHFMLYYIHLLYFIYLTLPLIHLYIFKIIYFTVELQKWKYIYIRKTKKKKFNLNCEENAIILYYYYYFSKSYFYNQYLFRVYTLLHM